ncbi:hypothetical protein [Bacillus velezensis]|uniref:hypothetical protein n=1 Tax=Bacillus velezensis TaxID=492670 RepID=UPI001919372F|nr:hypothetical protein [Bacillus velezensis]
MGKATEYLERYEELQEEFQAEQQKANRLEAQIEVKKDELTKMRSSLEEKGVKFSSVKELKEIKKKKEERLDDLLSKMESTLGLDEEDDEEDDWE